MKRYCSIYHTHALPLQDRFIEMSTYPMVSDHEIPDRDLGTQTIAVCHKVGYEVGDGYFVYYVPEDSPLVGETVDMAAFNLIRLQQGLQRLPVLGMNWIPFADETPGPTDYSQRNMIVSRRRAFCRPVFDNLDMALLDVGKEDMILAKI